jgi:hypothetical protein
MPLNSGSTAIHPYDGLSLTCGARNVTRPLERSRQRLGKEPHGGVRCALFPPRAAEPPLAGGNDVMLRQRRATMSLLCSARETSTSVGVFMRRYGRSSETANGGFTLINKSPDTYLQTR